MDTRINTVTNKKYFRRIIFIQFKGSAILSQYTFLVKFCVIAPPSPLAVRSVCVLKNSLNR